MAGGACLREPAWAARGVDVLRWLVDAQTIDGYLSPIGNLGWWPQGSVPARFDQQPIEAASILEAAVMAMRVTHDGTWWDVAQRAYGWYLGRNAIGTPPADPADGSCRDGLSPAGINANRGAESTLAWLSSVETLAALDGYASRAP